MRVKVKHVSELDIEGFVFDLFSDGMMDIQVPWEGSQYLSKEGVEKLKDWLNNPIKTTEKK